MDDKPKITAAGGARFSARPPVPTSGMTLPERVLLAAYPALTAAIPRPVVLALVRQWARRNPGEESVERARERLALDQPARPAGRIVWLHSIGPGDSTALHPLIRAIRTLAPGTTFLVTTRTVDAQGVFKRIAEEGDVVTLLAPLDSPIATRRFLDHWGPGLAVFCEWDIWPNTLRMLRARGVPVALVNAQFNGRMGKSLRRSPRLGRWLMHHLDLLHVFLEPCEAEAPGWVRPDCRIVRLPNLKMDAPPLEPKADLRAEMRDRWADRPVLVAASAATREIETLLDAFRRAQDDIADLALILVPRWTQDADGMELIVREAGLPAPRRSREGLPDPTDDVFIADSYGEMGTWFDLGFAVFMGHTLFGGHGHNAFEPVMQGRPVISGSIPSFLAADYTYLAGLGLCHVAPTAADIALATVDLHRNRTAPGEAVRFAALARDRGFSVALARRLLALAEPAARG